MRNLAQHNIPHLKTLHVGLAAYGANERFFWNEALVRCGAVVRTWDIQGSLPSDPLDIWVVVLDRERPVRTAAEMGEAELDKALAARRRLTAAEPLDP